jgi:voltage-gated potassium channel
MAQPKPITGSRELKNIGYELFIGGLSILSIFNLVWGLVTRSNEDIQGVLAIMNAIITPIFIADFCYRLFTAESKSGYFLRGFGWADLLASLPFQQVKIFRVFRLWRVIRLSRTFGLRNLLRQFIDNRAQNALLTVVLLVMLVLEFGSLAILRAEMSSPDANITDASDALWYTYVTITTVGYGDRYPVTNDGRLVGIVIMTAGVGLFGTLAGFVANVFLAPGKRNAEVEAPADANDPKAKLAEIKTMLEAQEKASADLKVKLEQVERLL